MSGAADAAGRVARIIYASHATIHESPYQEMERIRASAVRNNLPTGVTTALLYQSGWYVQWKEGPAAALMRIMDRVACDPRHETLRIVHSSRGPRLLTGSWSMALAQCDEPEADMRRRVEEVRAAVDAGESFTPTAIWRRLSTPMRHPGARRQQDAAVFQRLLVCAAAGTASFGVVQWLADRYREERVHQRYAGADTPDVAADYVDFFEGERVLRVVAMARNGLQLPLTRALLADYAQLVLLLCGDEERDMELVRRIAQACIGLAEPPALVGVAAQTRHHDAAFAMARRFGLVYLRAMAPPREPAACWAALVPLLAQWQHAAGDGAAPALARRA